MTRLTHILALWLVLLLGGQPLAHAGSMVCGATGAPMKACPCASSKQASKAAAEAQLERSPCCQLIEASDGAETSRLPSVTQSQVERAPAPHQQLAVPRADWVFTPLVAAASSSQTEPQGALYLRLRQLLI